MPPRGAVHHLFDTYVVARDATMKKGLRSGPGKDVLVGLDATILGSIDSGASAFLSKGAVVRGSVHAALDIVVGAKAVVEAGLDAGGNIVVLESARVGADVRARGNVRVIGARIEGVLHAGGDIEVRGESHAREIRAGGRVRSLAGPEEDAA